MSRNDYPQAATDNAKRAIKANEEKGNECATDVGKQRAQQLADRENISDETIERTYSYLSRAQEYDDGDWDSCGTISYNLWGGDEMLSWCERVLNEENEKHMKEDVFQVRAFPKVTRRSSDNKRTTVVISTDGVDRHGTVIDPEGAVLDNYQQNPVFLINHNYDLLAGSGAEITVQNNQIVANIDDDMWDLEDERIVPYYNKVKSGKMRAASIGFIPRKVEWEDEEGNPLDEPIIRKWELLEFSFVTVPSNPDALVTVRNYTKESKELTDSIRKIEKELEELRETKLDIDLEKLSNLVQERLDRQPLNDTDSEAREGQESASESVDWEKLEQRTVQTITDNLLKKLGRK